MWGTLGHYKYRNAEDRITPTCVGNTTPCNSMSVFKQDHPHLCGEHFSFAYGLYYDLGSPPPVWGTLLETDGISIDKRITPTCVGNTSQ